MQRNHVVRFRKQLVMLDCKWDSNCSLFCEKSCVWPSTLPPSSLPLSLVHIMWNWCQRLYIVGTLEPCASVSGRDAHGLSQNVKFRWVGHSNRQSQDKTELIIFSVTVFQSSTFKWVYIVMTTVLSAWNTKHLELIFVLQHLHRIWHLQSRVIN